MNKAKVFHKKVLKELETYTLEKVDKYFSHLANGDGRDQDYFREVYRKMSYPCWYYQYLACVVKVLKAKYVLEIGADKGVSALMMASEISDGEVYSIDIRQGWEYVPNSVTNIVKLVGSSQDIERWKNLSLEKIDLWLIDGNHDELNVKGEIRLFSPFWKKGTIVIFDDLNSIGKAWTDLTYDKYQDNTIHGNGFGLICV